MISKLRTFISRHKKKFFIGSLLIGGTVLLSHYARQKLHEWQERKAIEYLERTRKQQHFESTERTCNQTILALYRSLIDTIIRSMSTEDLVNKLKNSPENRIEIWNEIKIVSFTKVTTTIYAAVILVAILRVQLSLIGGYLIKQPESISGTFQQKYLSLCHRYLNKGIKEMISIIQEKVSVVLSKFDLKQKMTLQEIEMLFWSIQSQLSSDLNDPILKMNDLLIGTEKNTDIANDESLQIILNETLDLLESEEIKNICTSNISRSYSYLIDCVAEYYTSRVNGTGKIKEIKEDVSFINPTKNEIPMAKIIPIINGMVNRVGDSNSENFVDILIQQLLLNEQFKKLGANVYEAFCCEPE